MTQLRKLSRVTILLMTLITLSCVSTSCEPYYDDYDSYLTGTWIYQGDADGNFFRGDDNEFYFAPGGRGTYSCYSDNGYGPWTTYPITWWTNGQILTIQVSDWDIWRYEYDNTPGWLYLYPDYGGPYLVYSRR